MHYSHMTNGNNNTSGGENMKLDTREKLIAWLENNDPNGCFTDEDAIAEYGHPHTWTDLISLYAIAKEA